MSLEEEEAVEGAEATAEGAEAAEGTAEKESAPQD